MKAKQYITKIAGALLMVASLYIFSACNDELTEANNLTPEQRALIGKAVVFDPYVEGFRSRSVNHDGFNAGDVMYIFRQAMNNNGTYEPEEEWKTYEFKAHTDPSGNILFTQWEIKIGTGIGFRNRDQDITDSIFWENGKSVRFRAYSKSYLYDDYLYADYMSTSGPMGSVPMEFKHLGCRIGFQPYNGNTFTDNITYCTDPADYMREDNANSEDKKDDEDMLTEAEATQVANAVKETFNKICVPGGIAMYANAGNNWYTRNETTGAETTTDVAQTDLIPQFGQLTAKSADGKGEVLGKHVSVDNTMRPNWKSNLDGYRYCIMIPYEMNGVNEGSPITIPAKTRFKIYLKDVNTKDQENQYHIFSLWDIKEKDASGKVVTDANGIPKPKYPNGITLRAGYSYVFIVGYKYNKLEVRLNEEGINWSMPDKVSLETEQIPTQQKEPTYEWWSTAMTEAANRAMADNKNVFNPVFEISNMEQWLEFTDIVNGTFKYDPSTIQYEEDGKTIKRDEDNKIVGAEGCIKYLYYYAPKGMTSKYTEERILSEAFDFSGMTIKLKGNLDFQDKVITSIGTEVHKFKGFFDGGGHILSNFYGTVFDYVERPNEKNMASIEGLQLQSTQPISAINNANGTVIKGIAVNGPSTHAITTTINNCDVIGCCHLGIGNNNGSLLGNGSGNMVSASYIAAAGKGTLTDDTSFSGTFAGCYYDCTLSPAVNAIGNEYTITHNDVIEDYGARAVISSVLKAVKDNKPDQYTKEEHKVYYGIAPYSVMNQVLEAQKITKYKYEAPNNYNDRYPVLKLN